MQSDDFSRQQKNNYQKIWIIKKGSVYSFYEMDENS